MRNTVAKRLRQAALHEMMLDNVPKRDLVLGRNSVVNSPQSVRALYLQLKHQWMRPKVDAPTYKPVRVRPRSGFYRKALATGPALIEAPLRLIRNLFPALPTPTGGYQLDPTTALAMAWAKAGRGDKVSGLARRLS